MNKMIDREARDRAADLVEQFWNGIITNRELERAWPDSRDKAIFAVEDFVWTLYDDFATHTVNVADNSDPKLSRIIRDCIAYLRSDEMYTWPHFSTLKGAKIYPMWAVVVSLGLLGMWNRSTKYKEKRYWAEMRAHGDVDAWPFLQKPDPPSP